MLGGLDYHTISVAVQRAISALAATGGMIAKTIGTAKGSIVGFSAASTPAEVAVGSDGKALSADSSQAAGVVYIDNPSRPNLLVNPNFQIDQINEGGLYTMNGAAAFGPDGWSGEAVGGGGGVFKVRTLADPDNAALKCLEITCTTADVAIAAAERYSIFTAIEGYDAAALQAGVASAQPITVQFKFKSNVLGVYGVSIANSAKNRSYVGIITVADANEHEYSLSLTMDTAGAWLYTNGVGLYLRLTLAGGANFQAAAGAWAAADNYTTAAQCNFMSVNTNIAYLKRVQLIPGALVQAYKPADIQKELAKAQRYYCKSFAQGTAVAQNSGSLNALSYLVQVNGAAAGYAIYVNWPGEMRATPNAVTGYNPSAANANWRNSITAADSAALTVTRQSSKGALLNNFQVAGDLASHTCFVHWSSEVRLS